MFLKPTLQYLCRRHRRGTVFLARFSISFLYVLIWLFLSRPDPLKSKWSCWLNGLNNCSTNSKKIVFLQAAVAAAWWFWSQKKNARLPAGLQKSGRFEIANLGQHRDDSQKEEKQRDFVRLCAAQKDLQFMRLLRT